MIFVENFESFVGPGFCENQKMVLVNGDQYPKSYLWSIVYWNLKNVNNPNEFSTSKRTKLEFVHFWPPSQITN